MNLSLLGIGSGVNTEMRVGLYNWFTLGFLHHKITSLLDAFQLQYQYCQDRPDP